MPIEDYGLLDLSHLTGVGHFLRGSSSRGRSRNCLRVRMRGRGRGKNQNSQNAQKCLRRMLKVIWGLPAESPERVSRTVQTLFRTGGKCPKRGFAPCKRPFWESHPEGLETPFAPSLSTFGHLGCFDSCTRRSEPQHEHTHTERNVHANVAPALWQPYPENCLNECLCSLLHSA